MKVAYFMLNYIDEELFEKINRDWRPCLIRNY